MSPPSMSILPIMAALLGSTTAFIAPVSRCTTWCRPNSQRHQQRSAAWQVSSSTPSVTRRRSSSAVLQMSVSDETVEQKAQKLQDAAAAIRAQAAELEEKQKRERREGADRSFKAFDSNNDGSVGIAELRAGLEGPLKKTFTAQLTARMGRKPTPEEVDAKVLELPGGTLFPDDLAKRLIQMYDQNGDGALQQSEFAPTEELRARLESIFRERREEELEARKAEKKREMDSKSGAKGKGKSSKGSSDGEAASATAAEKALCALPYILPLSDGIVYARHIYSAYPQQMAWSEPLAALLIGVNSLPFATLVAFFGMSILSRNQNINKLLRFNMLQAINFDIALIVPSVFGPLLTWSLGSDAYKISPVTDLGTDLITVSLVLAVVYSIGASATGTLPNKIPFFGRINRVTRDD
ncbi:unnamed protein product [Pylaiella littoralis]